MAEDMIKPTDEDDAAAILHRDQQDRGLTGEGLGGGGLGGASAAVPSDTAGTTRNNPIDVPAPAPDSDGKTERDAVAEAAREVPTEPHPGSL